MTTWSPPTLGVQITMGILFGTLVAIGFAGNILVCKAIYSNKRLRKKENLYFVSLAVADFILSTLIMPFAAFNDIAGHWIFGEYCKYWMSLDIMCCTCSILHLCAISFDRYYHINDPMVYTERMTGRKILTAILAVWTFSSVVAFVPLSFDTHFDQALSPFWTNSSSANFNNGNAITNGASLLPTHSSSANNNGMIGRRLYQCSFNLEPIYAIVSSLVSFYIPSVIMLAAYTKLYRYAQRHAQTIRHQMKAAASLLNTSSAVEQQTPQFQHKPPSNQLQLPPGAVYKQPPQKRQRRRRLSAALSSNQNLSIPAGVSTPQTKRRELISSDSKARVTLGAIVGTFLFSWFPFFVCNIIRAYCTSCVPDWLFITLTWMGYANSAQNPIIYSIFNRDFRYAFRKILLCNRKTKRQGTSGGGSATGHSITGADDLVVVNGHTRTTTVIRKSSEGSYMSGSTAL